MAAPRVTIITPTYNHEQYIGACIDSVLAQDFADWEQVIVDDGSPDGTLDVVRRYDDPRIRVIAREHLGIEALGKSYNDALAASHGGLVCILEGDDLWPAGRLSAQLPVFDDASVVLSWGRGVLVDTQGHPLGPIAVPDLPEAVLRNRPPGAAVAFMKRDTLLTPTSSVMMRRTALDAIGGFRQVPGTRAVDTSTFLRMAMQGEFAFVDQVLGLFRQHPVSITATSHLGVTGARMLGDFWEGLSEAQRAAVPLSEAEVKARLTYAELLEAMLGRDLLGVYLAMPVLAEPLPRAYKLRAAAYGVAATFGRFDAVHWRPRRWWALRSAS